MVKKTVLAISALIVLSLSVWSFVTVSNSQGPTASVISGITGRAIIGEGDKEMIVTPENSEFSFEGFTIGKSHVGTFDDFEGSLIYNEGKIVGVIGKINTASVNTGIEKLNTHLKSDDFFDVEKYPEILINSREVNYEEQIMIVDLTFRGITKPIEFPATISDKEISADFMLDTTDFNMKYLGVDKVVRIKFSFK